jgi:hypothetical protein
LTVTTHIPTLPRRAERREPELVLGDERLPRGWRQHWLTEALLATLVPWVLARVAVVMGFVLATVSVDQLAVRKPDSLIGGLGGWDAGMYHDIAERGYDFFAGSYRFFPLYPVLTSLLRPLTFGHTTVAAVLIANAASLALGVALYRLVLLEVGNARAARISVWLLLTSAAAVPLTMGYAESLGLLAVVAATLAVRQRQWLRAVPWGLAVGLTWSVGALAAVLLLTEAAIGFRRSSTRVKLRRIAAGVSPIVGSAIYVGWVEWTAGAWYDRIVTIQTAVYNRSLHDPVSRVVELSYHAVVDHPADAVFLPWIALAGGLLVLAYRRLPLSYALYATAIVLVALSANNVDSLERYLLRAFPLAIAGALPIRGERTAWTVAGLSLAATVAYATAIFIGAKVP